MFVDKEAMFIPFVDEQLRSVGAEFLTLAVKQGYHSFLGAFG